MPDRETPGSGSSRDPGVTRLEAVERLRRQLEQAESGADDSADHSGSTRPPRRSRRGKRPAPGESSAPSGLWRSDGGPVAPEGDEVSGGIRSGGGDSRRSARSFADPDESSYGESTAGGAHRDSTSGGSRGDRIHDAMPGERADAPQSGRRRSRRARGDAPRFEEAPPDDESGESGRPARRGSRRGGADAGEQPPGGGTEAQAKDVCLRLLTDRARSRAELADKLAAKGFAAEVAERALNRLAAVGLINDAAFAEQWVHSRHTFSGKGKKVLAEELRRKGVAPEIAAPALEAITGDHERARAADLVQQKLRTLPRDLDRDKATCRLVGMLARRGYEPSTAYTVVTAELATAEFPDPPRQDDLDSENRGLQRRRPQRSSRSESSLIESSGHGESYSEAYRLQRRPPERSPRPERSVVRSPGREEPYPILRVALAGATIVPTADIDDAAIALLRRRLQTMPRDLDRDKKIRRLIGILARRGYSQSQAYRIVKAEVAAGDGE